MRRLVACLVLTVIVLLPATSALAADGQSEDSVVTSFEWGISKLQSGFGSIGSKILAWLSLGDELSTDGNAIHSVGQTPAMQRIGPTMDPNGALDPRFRQAPVVPEAVQQQPELSFVD